MFADTIITINQKDKTMLAKNYPIVGMKLSDVLKDPNTTVYQSTHFIDGSEIKNKEILTIDVPYYDDVEIQESDILCIEDNWITLHLGGWSDISISIQSDL